MLFNWVMTTWGPQLCHKLTSDLTCHQLEEINYNIRTLYLWSTLI